MTIVDPNGKSMKTEQEVVTYEVGNIKLDSNQTPNNKLEEGLIGARQMAAAQLSQMARQRMAETGVAMPEESLRLQVMAEASKITDPFKMEPCAQAIFMLLAIEISQRDDTIKSLNDRIEKLEECLPKQKTESSLEDGSQTN